MGRPSLREPRNCLACGVEFMAKQCELRRGGAKYCSPACSHPETPMERILRRREIDPATECWLWTGWREPKAGYGQTWYQGKNVPTHRVMWILQHGPISPGLFVLHRCDNPPCFNPTHLFLGTPHANSADMVAKGRQARGERHGWHTKPESRMRGDANPSRRHPETVLRGEQVGTAKLTAAQVVYIRERCASGAHGVRTQTARELGVSLSAVSAVLHGRRWCHVPATPSVCEHLE